MPQGMPRADLSRIVVAIDGPSGSGKSSTSRGVAAALGLRYLDTGAQFRALTVWMLRNGVDVNDAAAVTARTGEPDLISGTDPLNPTIEIDGDDVAEAIRSEQTTLGVSAVAAVPAIRTRLLDLQRSIIGEGGIVVEGRDIGSVVAPDADLKLYLTADPSARARRRTAEQAGDDIAATEADLHRRDQLDSSRATAPLTIPDGAIHLDTTDFTLDEVIAKVVELVETAGTQA